MCGLSSMSFQAKRGIFTGLLICEMIFNDKSLCYMRKIEVIVKLCSDPRSCGFQCAHGQEDHDRRDGVVAGPENTIRDLEEEWVGFL